MKNAEEHFNLQLKHAGYKFKREFRFDPNRRWKADFYLPAGRLIVEIEGIGYGRSIGRHQSGVGYASDCEKYNRMTEMGFRLFRFVPAQVFGRMKTRKGKPMPAAIDVVDGFVLGEALMQSIDRAKSGYAKT